MSLAAPRRPRRPRSRRRRSWSCPGSQAGKQPRSGSAGPSRGSGGAAGEAGRRYPQRWESGAAGWALPARGVRSMRAGRARPLRAADMKKDVRILLVGERESARRGPRSPSRPGPARPSPRARASQPLNAPLPAARRRPSASRLTRALLTPPAPDPKSSSPALSPRVSDRRPHPSEGPLLLSRLESFPPGPQSVSEAASFSEPLVFRGDSLVTARQVLIEAG